MNGQPGQTPQVPWARIVGIFIAVSAGIYVISRALRVLREGLGGGAPFSGGGSGPFDYLPPVQRVIFSLVAWGMLLLAACVVVRILKR
jgi:hypothetical protein